MTREQRAWREYLDWTRGAIPKEYDLTEQRAWERLQRDVLWVRVLTYAPAESSDPESNHQGEGGRIENPHRAEGSEGQWQRWSEGWKDD